MGGMDLWVSYPLAFKQLDDYINKHQTEAELLQLELQFNDANPAFAPSVATPIPLQSGSEDHFRKHWIGTTPGQGGAYWPYLSDIDVGQMLRYALQASVRIFTTARTRGSGTTAPKYHTTLWTCAQEVPAAYMSDPASFSMTREDQEKIFRIAVLELDHFVMVLISTPEPMPSELAAIHAELEVAYLVPHYQLATCWKDADGPCEWIQYAHPLPGRWQRDQAEVVTCGEGPQSANVRRTVPGEQRIDTSW